MHSQTPDGNKKAPDTTPPKSEHGASHQGNKATDKPADKAGDKPADKAGDKHAGGAVSHTAKPNEPTEHHQASKDSDKAKSPK